MKQNVFGLFGAMVVLLMATVALTLFRGTAATSSIATLKCYEVTRPIEKPCEPRIIKTSVEHTQSD